MPAILMHIAKYIPDRMYGFASGGDGSQVFFHLGVFNPKMGPPVRCCMRDSSGDCWWVQQPAPPIIGEPVHVTLADGSQEIARDAPRASRVDRVDPPIGLRGIVETFDVRRGYGFVVGDNQQTYYLHRCEVAEGRIPAAGQSVVFYAGMSQGRPRACHVKVCSGVS